MRPVSTIKDRKIPMVYSKCRKSIFKQHAEQTFICNAHHWKCKRERRCHFFNNILIEIFLITRGLMKSEETIIGRFGKVRIYV
nr:unnamed protein product [Callosobruchus analis]